MFWKLAVIFLVNVFLAVSSFHVVKHETHLSIDSLENRLGIVGGSNTTIEQHPYQCAVIYYGSFFCACAILNKNWVLTLGDCIYGASAENYQVRVGSASTAGGGSLYGVRKLASHPSYNVTTRDYDFGLLKLNDSLVFNNEVKRVKLPSNALKSGQQATVSGWGGNYTGNLSPFQDLNVTGVKRKTCQDIYSPYNYAVTNSMVCATALKAGPCYNDFGDPLVDSGKVFGLFSWSFNCGDDSFPAVYASVPAGVAWIKSTIKN